MIRSQLPKRPISKRSRGIALAAVLGAGLVPAAVGDAAGDAGAAPQILGLIASNGAVPMQCDRDTCWAEVTAFCMQPRRPSPRAGTAYTVAERGMISLRGTRADGTTIVLGDLPVDIETLRGHSAVRIAIDADLLDQHGVSRPSTEVARGAILLPVPVAEDKTPLRDQEIAAAMGPMRTIAQNVIDRDPDQADAARLTNAMLNRLPLGRPVGQDKRDGLFMAAVPESVRASVSPKAVAVAKEAHSRCRQPYQTMRQCLGSFHDSIIGRLNNDYWGELNKLY